MRSRVTTLVEEKLSHSVIGAFFDVYNTLGYGFLEHVYLLALERELLTRGHQVGREVSVGVYYKGEELTWQRLDMVVDGRLVIEVKAGRELPRSASRQLLNYLRATRLEVGLLLYFGHEPEFYRIVSTFDRRVHRGDTPLNANAADRADLRE